jgi:hypothetical protein
VNFEVSIMASWVVEEWNSLESSLLNSVCQVAWDFCYVVSFESLKSLNVYMSSPMHLKRETNTYCGAFILWDVMDNANFS